MKVTKSVALSKVQALACEHVFTQLQVAHEAYAKAETVAKARFAVVLHDAGIGVEYVNTARYEATPDGARLDYDVEEDVLTEEDKPVFEVPPSGDN